MRPARAGQALRADRTAVVFESVQHPHARAARVAVAVEIDEVAVGQFAARAHARRVSQQAVQRAGERPAVRAGEAGRRPERRRADHA